MEGHSIRTGDGGGAHERGGRNGGMVCSPQQFQEYYVVLYLSALDKEENKHANLSTTFSVASRILTKSRIISCNLNGANDQVKCGKILKNNATIKKRVSW